MPLTVAIGHASAAGPRPANEDFVGAATPTGADLAAKGIVAAVADGVSGHAGGREAAEYTVRGLLTDYYATPDTWETSVALERVLAAINRWVVAQAQQRREVAGMASTLTALVLRGRRYTIAHVGDTRAYRLRAGVLQRLTTDHVWDRPDMAHVLTRAIGLDSRLALDITSDEAAIGDRFVLLSDGVWSVLREAALSSLASTGNAENAAQALVDAALAAGSSDNASAIVLAVDDLPTDGLADVVAAAAQRDVPHLLQVGEAIDGLRVTELLHRSAATVLYKVLEIDSGQMRVLKTLTPERGLDPLERRLFAHEEWLAKRAVARFFPQVIVPPADRQSALYYLQTWHAGRTLGAALAAGRHFTVPELLAIAIKLARGVGALHRRNILHRDIKPENVHLGDDEEVRILDLGVAVSGLDPDRTTATRAGTPSFLAPELFEAGAPNTQTDLYALGVTLYFAFTRRYPYGEVEPFQRPRFADPTPPTRYRPDLPAWLEATLLKAVARDPRNRFETAEELLLALERGAARPVSAPPPTPLAARDPLTLWRLVAIASLVANLLLLWLLLVS